MKLRTWLLLLLGAMVAVSLYYGAGSILTVDEVKARHDDLLALYDRRPIVFIATFMLVQVTALSLCVPGAVLTMALAGGALFGPLWGTLIVLSALTVGDSLGFLVARYFMRDWAWTRFGSAFNRLSGDQTSDGPFVLLSLRLMAVVPFFVVNISMALTRMPLPVFAVVSFVGLAPATTLYVNAGTMLSEIDSAAEILSARTILMLAALGALPIVTRIAARYWPARVARISS